MIDIAGINHLANPYALIIKFYLNLLLRILNKCSNTRSLKWYRQVQPRTWDQNTSHAFRISRHLYFEADKKSQFSRAHLPRDFEIRLYILSLFQLMHILIGIAS